MENEKVKQAFFALGEKWPSTFVSRDKISEFTGGAISQGRMANLDYLGDGPNRFRLGRKVCYPVDDLIKWLCDRVDNITPKKCNQIPPHVFKEN